MLSAINIGLSVKAYGGGYSGYGYRSYSFPGGGKVPFGDLRIVSSIYIDYKYIINIYL